MNLLSIMAIWIISSCGIRTNYDGGKKLISVILDTDANNELDDQHAIAYLLFSGNQFQTRAITVNRTHSGGDISKHMTEANRVVRLCGASNTVKVLKGAEGNFLDIQNYVHEDVFDGSEAVDFIIKSAHAMNKDPLVLLPIGKLTNIALALKRDPAIANKVRIVWLGSNYPRAGEYNLENDTAALNYILDLKVRFEMVTVRYGEHSGTDVVRATPDENKMKMAGKGPKVTPAVEGRHGGTFSYFGDYSIDLFNHINLHGTPPSRALFDMAAVAVVKNASWAKRNVIPAPILKDGKWIDRPNNPRKITVWENFDKEKILNDFYNTINSYKLPSAEKL